MEGPTPRDIFIIKPSSLGDVVHTLPAVALVKKQWPSARLRWLVNPEWAPLLDGNPTVDEVVIFPRRELRGVQGLTRIPAWSRQLRSQVQADLVLDFQGLLRSALISRVGRAPGGRIVGLSDAREGATFFYDQTAAVGEIPHAVDRYLALVKLLGIDISGPLDWPLPTGAAPVGFDASTPFVLLHPFSRGTGKSLSPAELTAFCQALSPQRVVVAGRSEEAVPTAAHLVNLLNQTTLGELIWLIRHAAFVISVDSGPMHIAAALNPRLLSIHTWSDPRKVGPYAPDAWVWKDGALFQKKNLEHPAEHRSVPTLTDLAAESARLAKE